MPQPARLPDSPADLAADSTPSLPRSGSHLERAIGDRPFTPHFQPIVSLESGQLLAAEALARRTDADSEPPAGYPGRAGGTGAKAPGRQMLRRAAELLGEWGDAAPARIHLDVSPPELGGEVPLEEELRRVSREQDVHLGRLCVEISERQARVSAARVRRIRELGVQVALDDFGAGYASYGLLGEFPVTDLKLDASLVRSVDTSERHRIVIRRIADLARDLGIRVVAEGVRTAGQARTLREAGCRVGQGRFFGRPQAPAEFERTLFTSIPHRSNGSSG